MEEYQQDEGYDDEEYGEQDIDNDMDDEEMDQQEFQAIETQTQAPPTGPISMKISIPMFGGQSTQQKVPQVAPIQKPQQLQQQQWPPQPDPAVYAQPPYQTEQRGLQQFPQYQQNFEQDQFHQTQQSQYANYQQSYIPEQQQPVRQDLLVATQQYQTEPEIPQQTLPQSIKISLGGAQNSMISKSQPPHPDQGHTQHFVKKKGVHQHTSGTHHSEVIQPMTNQPPPPQQVMPPPPISQPIRIGIPMPQQQQQSIKAHQSLHHQPEPDMNTSLLSITSQAQQISQQLSQPVKIVLGGIKPVTAHPYSSPQQLDDQRATFQVPQPPLYTSIPPQPQIYAPLLPEVQHIQKPEVVSIPAYTQPFETLQPQPQYFQENQMMLDQTNSALPNQQVHQDFYQPTREIPKYNQYQAQEFQAITQSNESYMVDQEKQIEYQQPIESNAAQFAVPISSDNIIQSNIHKIQPEPLASIHEQPPVIPIQDTLSAAVPYQAVEQPMIINQAPQVEVQDLSKVDQIETQAQIIVPPMVEELPQPKKKSQKQKKPKKIKGKGDFLRFYDIKKVKVTFELDPHERRARGQSIFQFSIKSEEEVSQHLDGLKAEDIYKKYSLDLRFHAKQLLIERIALLTQDTENNTNQQDELQMDYPHPDREQPQFQSQVFGNISGDIYSYECTERKQFEKEITEPVLIAKKVVGLNFKKDNLRSQLPNEIQVLVKYYLKSITDFGIHAVTYKNCNEDLTLDFRPKDSVSTYFHTSDKYESQQLWMPIVQGTSFLPLQWTFKYIVPAKYTVVSSGYLHVKCIEEGDNPRALFHYKLKDNQVAPAAKIGFIIGQFPSIHVMEDLTQIENAHAFFINQERCNIFTQNNRFYEKNIYTIVQYISQKLICAPYPFRQLKLCFVPNLFLKQSRKQSYDFSGGLHILDEEILFQRNQLESRHRTYKYLASSLAFDYFGGRVYEETPDDLWLLLGIRESIGNHFKIMKCGVLLYRYHIMQTIDSVYTKSKHGFERYPLKQGEVPNANELLLNNLVYEKCELIMHMIESMIDKSYFERIIREFYKHASPSVSTKLFNKIFKQVCGFNLKQFSYNWIMSTSCPKLTVTYNYNKKNNSLDLTLMQESAIKDDLVFRKYIKDNLESGELLTKPLVRVNPLQMTGHFADKSNAALKRHVFEIENKIGKFLVELKRLALKWFDGEVNVMLYLTDGADISTQQQKMSLKYGENSVSINIPLSVKVKKTIQNKKKEYESMQMQDHEEDDEDMDASVEKGNSKSAATSGGHLIDNNQWKFGLNEYELEDYPITTKTIFDVKNLESSVLWIRVDPDMEYIRRVKVKQDQNNWLFQLLLEKDIIGQIEAIKQLYKQKPPAQQQFVYEILQSVSTNENYFFKVRKVALKYLQRMLTSQFNEYLSHEKFLIKIFNQRNFDPSIGFYKSNNFSKILEYYFDKYLLKTMSKCKELRLPVNPDVLESVMAIIKPPLPQQQDAQLPSESGNISISIPNADLAQIKAKRAPREFLLRMSSDQIAQLLLKLLQENDNSENSYDDSHYLKQIIKSLGCLDNFKLMPEIAKEVYRQFKLDNIGRFSPQFAISKGAIAAYFNMRKQIHLFREEKLKLINMKIEDPQFYLDQIEQTEITLDSMGMDLETMFLSASWPYEVRFFIARYQIKQSFFYQGNSFLKALYIQLKKIDAFLNERRIRDACDYTRELADFLENQVERVDFREALLESERSNAIIDILWQMLCLPFNYLDCSLTYHIKRIYYFIYGPEPPIFVLKRQEEIGVKQEPIEYDTEWSQENLAQADNGNVGISIAREMLAKSRQKLQIQKNSIAPSIAKSLPQTTIKILEPTNSHYSTTGGQKMDKIDTKLKIVLPVLNQPDQSVMQQASQWGQQAQVPSFQGLGGSIKISLGGISLDQVKPPPPPLQKTSSSIQIPIFGGLSQTFQSQSSFQQQKVVEPSGQRQDQYDSSYFGINQTQQQKMQSQSMDNNMMSGLQGSETNRQSYGGQNDVDMGSGNLQDKGMDEEEESIYDEFAEISFNVDWMQKIWDVTGHLWYHEESQAFLEPVKKEDLGDYFEYYLSIIDYPIDLTTIKERIKDGYYSNVGQWRMDIDTMFNNCKKFNEEESDIYQSALKLQRFYFQDLRNSRLVDQSSTIRIR